MVRWGPRSGPREFHVEIHYVSRNSASGVCLSKELLHPMIALQRNFWFRCWRQNAGQILDRPTLLVCVSTCPCGSYGLSVGRRFGTRPVLGPSILIACMNSGYNSLERCTCCLLNNCRSCMFLFRISIAVDSQYCSSLFELLIVVCRMIWWNRSFQLCTCKLSFYSCCFSYLCATSLFV